MNLNRIQIIGNLTRDPEARSTNSGARVVNFSVAVNERYGNRDETIYLKVEAWNKTGEIAEKYLQKGKMVYVEGRIRLEEYTTREGEKRRDVVVVASNIILGPKGGPREGGQDDDRGGYQRQDTRSRHSDDPRREQPSFREEAPARDDYNDYPQTNDASHDGGDSPENDLPF